MKIQNYTTDQPAPDDILLGSNASSNNATANFKISDILALGNGNILKFDDMVGGTLTGVGTTVKLSSVLIPGGSLSSACTLNANFRFVKSDVSITSSTVGLYVNTVDSIVGATSLGFALATTTSNRASSFSRNFYIKDGELRGLNFGSNVLLDESEINFVDSSLSIDINSNLYFMVAVTNVGSSTTITVPYSRYLIYK
jgi:hypothetical protein